MTFREVLRRACIDDDDAVHAALEISVDVRRIRLDSELAGEVPARLVGCGGGMLEHEGMAGGAGSGWCGHQGASESVG
jgi:hypothetical protein